MNSQRVIEALHDFSPSIRYVAVYHQGDLRYRQRDNVIAGASASETDRYEELLVNPGLLTLAGQRGNIDCGGLNHLLIGYGNFYQLVKATEEGHLSVCLDQKSDLNNLPEEIFAFVRKEFPGLGLTESTTQVTQNH